MNDEKPEGILETPQISRFQHENVFALSFQNELEYNKSSLINRSNSTIFENQSVDHHIDISEPQSATPLISAFAKLTPIVPVTPISISISNPHIPTTTTTPILNGNLSSAPKKTLLMRTQSQTDDQNKSQQFDALKLFLQNTSMNGDINHTNSNNIKNNNNNVNINNNNNNSPQLVNQNNNDISDSIIIEDEDKPQLTLLNQRTSDANTTQQTLTGNLIQNNTNNSNNNDEILVKNETNKKLIVIKSDTADMVKNILSAIGKPLNNNNNSVLTAATTQGIGLQAIIKNNNNYQQTASIPIQNTSVNHNTIASIISNHKRNNNENITSGNTKSIKLTSISAPGSLIQTSLLNNNNNNSIAQNDDILIDTKALITSSSTDSDNSSISKQSADELLFDSNKKTNDVNEKRKEKRRTNTANNEARKQQIRNSNREAARRCRERRRLYIESLENNIKNLESKQKNLSNENSTLRKEINQLSKILLQHKDCNLTTTLAPNSYFATITQSQQQQQQQQQQLQGPVYVLEIPAAAVNSSTSSATPTLLTYTTTTNTQNIQHH